MMYDDIKKKDQHTALISLTSQFPHLLSDKMKKYRQNPTAIPYGRLSHQRANILKRPFMPLHD